MILSALYRARRPGAVTVRAIERAWTVLALKAPQFANVDDRIVQLVSHSKYSYSSVSTASQLMRFTPPPHLPLYSHPHPSP